MGRLGLRLGLGLGGQANGFFDIAVNLERKRKPHVSRFWPWQAAPSAPQDPVARAVFPGATINGQPVHLLLDTGR